MARKTVTVSDMTFNDEAAVPVNSGRKTNIPDSLLAAVKTLAPKSYVLPGEDQAKEFRALVRAAANLLERREGLPYGVKTAQESLSDGKVKVYFQGRMKDTGDQE